MTPSEMAKIDAALLDWADREEIADDIDPSDDANLDLWANRFSRILGREVLPEEVWEWLDEGSEDDEAYGHGV